MAAEYAPTAPDVTTTSVSGFAWRKQSRTHLRAMASRSSIRPSRTEYPWAPSRSAAWARSSAAGSTGRSPTPWARLIAPSFFASRVITRISSCAAATTSQRG